MSQATEMLVLDSGALTRLARRSDSIRMSLRMLRSHSEWPPVVPTVVMVESLQGHPGRDANTNHLLKSCLVEPTVSPGLARRAAELRRLARRGSAVDAIVIATAEPGGTVFTGDPDDLRALAAHAIGVRVVEL